MRWAPIALLSASLALAGCGGSAVRRAAPLDLRGIGAIPVRYALPRDSIPAIIRPQFDRPQALRGLLVPSSLVIGALIDGQPHAYPVDLLSFHEVVDDGPIAVSWCPLCQTAIAFDRDIGGRRLTFGVSGLLLSSNLVLYDRETGSLWSQLGERAISGRYRGTRLQPVPLAEITWGRWLRLHPDTLVLSIRGDRYASRFTHPFDYHDWLGLETSTDPYLGYSLRVGVARSGKTRGLGGATTVLGIRIGGVAKAYPLYLLHGPINDIVAGHRLRIVPRVRGFAASVFEGGRQLPATSGYWFAWQYFYPHSLIYSAKAS